MAELAKKDEPVDAPRAAARRGGGVLQEPWASTTRPRSSPAFPPSEDVSLYREGEFEDLCRGPHVPQHGQAEGLQADEGGRRLLARRPPQRDAAAHLRHGLGDQGRAGAVPARCSKRPRSATTASWAASSTCSTSTSTRRAWCSGTPRAGRSGSRSSSTCARVYRDNGYQEVKGPQILDKSLWEKTGHWDNYRENMFTTESEKRDYALKPMNCPGHILIFKQGIKSYRDLPLRYGEFGQCHRNEPSGGAARHHARARLHAGRRPHLLHRRPDPATNASAYTALLQKVYADFGFTDIIYKVATRPENRIGSDEVWDKAEHALMESLRRSGCEFEIAPGEGAFYGPKIEYTLKDAIGRQWQCGTMQVDFTMPERLGAEYVAETSGARTPGHAAPGHRRQPGALHRHPDRAPRRRAARLAGAGAGGGAQYHRCAGRLRPGSGQNAAESRA